MAKDFEKAASTKAAAGKATDKSGSAGGPATPMVMFSAVTRISGPDYVVEAGDENAAPIPKKFADIHMNEGHGHIVGGADAGVIK